MSNINELHSDASKWAKDTNYSLIEGITQAFDLMQRMPHRSASVDQRSLVQACQVLGLQNSDQDSDRPIKHHWDVTTHNITDMIALPRRLEHAGQYDYVLEQRNDIPKWIWDASSNRTVRATPEILQEGYIAVSYTWGRWKVGVSKLEGTDWNVPVVNCDFDIADLKAILSSIKICRFFWIDVLCINQDDPEETRDEISKQGAIFGSAKGVLVYLWKIPSGNDLAVSVWNLGNCLLRWLRLCASDEQERATLPINEAGFGDHRDEVSIQSDHWFSSLWTLQEMILAPASIWMARNGEFCRLNSMAVTTHQIASAIFLLSKLPPMRKRLLDRMSREYNQSQEISWIRRAQESDEEAFGVMRTWVQWGLRNASIGSCLSASRASVLLAGSKRTATANRGIAILAALKVGYNRMFEDNPDSPASIVPIPLISVIMRAEGASIFACQHGGEALSSMLPTSADGAHYINTTDFNALPCKGDHREWGILSDGSIVITKGTMMQKMKSGRCALFLNGGHIVQLESAKEAKAIIKKYLGERSIKVKFIPIAVRCDGTRIVPPFEHMILENVQGVVIVSTKDKRPSPHMDVRWHKVGMFNASDFTSYKAHYTIVVRGA